MNEVASQVSPHKAVDICQSVHLSVPAQELLTPEQSPRQFLDVLLGKERYSDAIKFIAAALPARESIWWGSLCLHLAAGPSLSPALAQFLQPVVRWVVDPTDAHRKEASDAIPARGGQGAPGNLDVNNTPPIYLLRAVAWTGGSLAPPHIPVVAPSPAMPGRAVGGAVLLTATQASPEKINERMRHFLVIGSRVGHGKYHWEPPHPDKHHVLVHSPVSDEKVTAEDQVPK